MKQKEYLETEDYRIYLGDFEEELRGFLSSRSYSHLCVIVDENTHRDCWPLLHPFLKENTLICIPPGESFKNIDTCQLIWKEMMEHEMGRNSLVINLGGGVIGDMGGFCASTYKRGVDFIQMPTTLLSQVDASVGGKLGIDFSGIKNSIGVFKNPRAVFIDPRFLKTLPFREIRSGFAEIIKHALIQDVDEWKRLKLIKDLSQMEWSATIRYSVSIKRDIVKKDPFEKGLRKALNFGHTIGHAVESVFLEKKNHLLHGEAIAIGMICESFLSHKKLGLSDKELLDVSETILKLYRHPKLLKVDFDAMLALMKNDKKNKGKEINFSLLPHIGHVEVDHAATASEIIESLEYYNSL